MLSAVVFRNSSLVQFLNIAFTGVKSDSQLTRALEYDHGNGYIHSCTFSGGYAAFGGAISMTSSTFSFSNVNFTNNSVQLSGGAIYAQSSSLIFSGENNFSHQVSFSGGAIYVRKSNLSCEGRVTFKNNSADYKGGAVCAEDSIVVVLGSSATRKSSMEEEE